MKTCTCVCDCHCEFCSEVLECVATWCVMSKTRSCITPESDDDNGIRSLKPLGGERTRLCCLGSTGRGGASACVKKRLLGPSTSAYFVDGRIEATGCGVLAGDEGRSASGCCSSMSVAIAAAQCAPAQKTWRFTCSAELPGKQNPQDERYEQLCERLQSLGCAAQPSIRQ